MGEWRRTTWGDEISLEYGKGIRGYSKSAGPYRVFGSNGPVGWTTEPLTPGPGVILGRKGAYRGVRYSPDPFYVIDTAYYVRPKTELDMRWLYYAIIYHKLGEIDDGSPIPSTTRSSVYVRDLDVPPLEEQREIALVLGALDDLIDQNLQINEALEAMARLFFKDWFVDFGPTRAKAEGRHPYLAPELWSLFPDALDDDDKPIGWENGCLGDFAIAKGGFAYKSEDFSTSGYRVIKIRNINSDRTVDAYDVSYIPEVIAERTREFWLEDGDLVMAMTGATIGKYGFIINPDSKPLLLNQRVAKLISKVSDKPWIVYCALFSTDIYDQIVSAGDGSAQPNISASGIMASKLVVPSKKAINAFIQTVAPLFEQLIANRKESLDLAALRDLLLPRLMSGEIRLREAEKLVEQVA